jgi:formylglycine-generating enzyme
MKKHSAGIHKILWMSGFIFISVVSMQLQADEKPKADTNPSGKVKWKISPEATVQPESKPEGYVYIKPGSFTMGSAVSEPGRYIDETQVRVTIKKGFWMKETEVPQAEFEKIMRGNPSKFIAPDKPVEQVTWLNAVEYCNRLSVQEKLPLCYEIRGTEVVWKRDAKGFRLPTEAEWEYACRAGTQSPYAFGDCLSSADANYNGNHPMKNCPVGEFKQITWEVRSGKPNAWGLFNMHGNVWEWCWDWHGDYPSGSATDPSGLSMGNKRVSRGGGWNSLAGGCRSALRNAISPDTTRFNLGFRPVISE